MSESQNDNVVDLENKRVELEAKARVAPTFGKADLLKKVGQVEYPYFEQIDAKVPLRRLGSGEWSEVEALQASGITLEGEPDEENPNDRSGLKMKIDVAETTRGEARARHQAVAYALSVGSEHYTADEVAQIPNVALIRAINAKALELSGVSAEAQEEIKRFRENARRGESGVDESPGLPAGDMSAGLDTPTNDVSGDSSPPSGDAT